MKANKVIRIILASLMLAVIISFQPAIAHNKITELEIQELHRSPIAGVEGKEMLVVRLKGPSWMGYRQSFTSWRSLSVHVVR